MSVYDRVVDHCSQLGTLEVVGFGLLLAVAIETFTLWARFGLGLQATRDTPLIGKLSFGVRIHHGYLGIVLGLAAWIFAADEPGVRNALLMVALALVVSDLGHHFLVLWPITGSPEFDLLYPRPEPPPSEAAGEGSPTHPDHNKE